MVFLCVLCVFVVNMNMSQKKNIPFGTISIAEQSKRLVMEILQTKRASSGKYVRMFEDQFAELLGVEQQLPRLIAELGEVVGMNAMRP